MPFETLCQQFHEPNNTIQIFFSCEFEYYHRLGYYTLVPYVVQFSFTDNYGSVCPSKPCAHSFMSQTTQFKYFLTVNLNITIAWVNKHWCLACNNQSLEVSYVTQFSFTDNYGSVCPSKPYANSFMSQTT